MKHQGFTLLEAIVALVLFTTIGMALLSWVHTNLLSLHRVQTVQQRHAAIRSALAFIETVNPLETSHGKEKIGVYQINWQAKAIVLPRDGISNSGYMSLFQVGLYEVAITVQLENEDVPLAQLTVRQAGFKQVHHFEVD